MGFDQKMASFGRFIFITCLALLTSCSTGKQAEPQIVASPDKFTLMLAEAADKASTALETLASVEQARTPVAKTGRIPNVPPELRRAMTINWVGPVEQLGRKLANRAGYDFITIGSPPPVPLVVSVNADNSPVIDIMRNVGLQMGQRADLKVNAGERVVEIHYASEISSGVSG
jgi:defect-in-organelle-trafficking protein DotD